VTLLALALSAALEASEAPPRLDVPDGITFAGGAAFAFVGHELGHVTANLAFGARPELRPVDFQGLPFFAVSHRETLAPRQEFTVSWAGFGVQHGTSEWILSRNPDLRHERAPFAKGALAFHVVCSGVYAVGALGRVGPYERDTRGMAVAAGVSEPVVGALVLAPAALDVYRYFRPRARWAAWASRAAKVGLLLLVLK
jgi:hypothetical protein